MEDFDQLKNKIKRYHSQLNIEDEWKSITIKREKISNARNLKVKKIIASIIAILLLSTLGYLCCNKAMFIPKTLVTAHEDEGFSNNSKYKAKDGENESIGKTANNSEFSFRSDSGVYVHEKHPQIKNNEPLSRVTESNLLNTVKMNDRNNLIEEEVFLKTRNNQFEENEFDNHMNSGPVNLKLAENLSSSMENEVEEGRLSKIKNKNTELEFDEKLSMLLPKPMMLLDENMSKAVLPHKLKYAPISNQKNKKLNRNYFLFELFGQGSFYSLNYGRILRETEKGETDFRIGLSLNPKKLNGIETGAFPLLIPTSINQSYKIKDKHYLSLGPGITLVNDKIANEPNSFYLLGHLKFGYKYQSPKSRIFYQAELLTIHAFENIFTSTDRFDISESSLWAGFGIGYVF